MTVLSSVLLFRVSHRNHPVLGQMGGFSGASGKELSWQLTQVVGRMLSLELSD